jgi:hypothetical protein
VTRACILSLSLIFLAARPGFSFATLAPEAIAVFDRYAGHTEARIAAAEIRDPKLRDGELRIESGRADGDPEAPGGMMQHWIGSMFIPGATIAQAQAVLKDYPNYKNYYAPKVTESKVLAHNGDDYEVFLRLYEKNVLTVVLNTTYRVHFSMPDARHLSINSHSARIAEVKDPDESNDKEKPVGNDMGFLWRLNTYWRLEAADGGVYARCEAVSLSRSAPLGFGFMLKNFLERFPKESMLNTLQGTREAVEKHASSSAALLK